MPMRWYLNLNDQTTGPFEESEVLGMIHRRELEVAWICHEGGRQWRALGAHEPFAEALLANQAGGIDASPTFEVEGGAGTHQQATALNAEPTAETAAPTAPRETPEEGRDTLADLLERLRLLVTNPRAYWSHVESLPSSLPALLPNIALLCGVGALCSLFGQLIALRGALALAPGTVLSGLLATAVLSAAASVGTWFAMALAIDLLAPYFRGRRDAPRARRLALGALTPLWVAGILGLLPLRSLAMVLSLGGLGYGAYLLWLGLPRLAEIPEDKALPFAAAVMGALLVLALVLNLLAACPAGCAASCALRAAAG